MPEYRIYKRNARGHLTGHALVLICEDDDDVILKVEFLVDGHDVVILDAARFVTRPQSAASSPKEKAEPVVPTSEQLIESPIPTTRFPLA